MLFVYGALQDGAVLGRPVAVSRLCPATAPGYRAVASWTAQYKPAVVGSETGTAMTLRQRLLSC